MKKFIPFSVFALLFSVLFGFSSCCSDADTEVEDNVTKELKYTRATGLSVGDRYIADDGTEYIIESSIQTAKGEFEEHQGEYYLTCAEYHNQKNITVAAINKDFVKDAQNILGKKLLVNYVEVYPANADPAANYIPMILVCSLTSAE